MKKYILTAFIIMVLSTAGYAANRMAKKHLALGDRLFQQHRVEEAIQEWQIALDLDKKLVIAKENIEAARYYQKHGEMPVKKEPEVIQTDVDNLPGAEKPIVKPQPKVPVDRIKTEILQIEKNGGRATKILINAGTANGVGVGMEGIVVELNGAPLAAFRVTAADTDKSLADIISLNRDVSNTAVAIVDRPRE